MEPKVSDDGSARLGQLGRTLGVGVYAFLVASFTIICSVQICLQVWAPHVEGVRKYFSGHVYFSPPTTEK